MPRHERAYLTALAIKVVERLRNRLSRRLGQAHARIRNWSRRNRQVVRVTWPGLSESSERPQSTPPARSVCLLLISDGRDELLERTIASAREMLPRWDQEVFIDDSAHSLGAAGAIQEGWRHVQTDYVFHLEQDFLFNVPVPLEEMIALLERRPYLAQVALRRQAVYEWEQAAGGMLEFYGTELYTECRDDLALWTEHRVHFTLNPCVYRSSLCQLGWPQQEASEIRFGCLLIIDPEVRFAYWGGKSAPPMVEHIGTHRIGHGY